MGNFKQENKNAVHSGCSKNCKYPVNHAYVVQDKIDDSSIIGCHTNGATEYWFPQGLIKPGFKPFIDKVKDHPFRTTLVDKKDSETYNEGMCYHKVILIFTNLQMQLCM